jgi:hypothetical protein
MELSEGELMKKYILDLDAWNCLNIKDVIVILNMELYVF